MVHVLAQIVESEEQATCIKHNSVLLSLHRDSSGTSGQ